MVVGRPVGGILGDQEVLMRKIATVFLAVLLGACGDDGGGGGSIALESFATELARASCAKAFECCTTAELTDMQMTTEESCRTSMGGFMTLFTSTMSTSQGQGRATYNAS